MQQRSTVNKMQPAITHFKFHSFTVIEVKSTDIVEISKKKIHTTLTKWPYKVFK